MNSDLECIENNEVLNRRAYDIFSEVVWQLHISKTGWNNILGIGLNALESSLISGKSNVIKDVNNNITNNNLALCA